MSSETKRAWLKQRYKKSRSQGLCGLCHKRKAKPNKAQCRLCATKHSKIKRKREDPTVAAKRAKEKRKRYKELAYRAYGGSFCACCGEDIEYFLTFDHMNDAKHRREVGNNELLLWMKQNDYPAGFKVHCYNCNSGRFRAGGKCPHTWMPQPTRCDYGN